MRIISVAKNARTLGFTVVLDDKSKKRPVVREVGGDEGEAAATAMQLTTIGFGQYVIIGPERVLRLIPEAVRAGSHQ